MDGNEWTSRAGARSAEAGGLVEDDRNAWRSGPPPTDDELNQTLMVDVLNKLTHLPPEMMVVVRDQADQLARRQLEHHWLRMTAISNALRLSKVQA